MGIESAISRIINSGGPSPGATPPTLAGPMPNAQMGTGQPQGGGGGSSAGAAFGPLAGAGFGYMAGGPRGGLQGLGMGGGEALTMSGHPEFGVPLMMGSSLLGGGGGQQGMRPPPMQPPRPAQPMSIPQANAPVPGPGQAQAGGQQMNPMLLKMLGLA